ncbi:Sec-independent protein translocase protein TatB [Azoarcus sp. KH32C]|uniref:Sec-independent protein translocase protein TatB n=1 Tax=Azoarcus sp. KH32C TaxID=748247 RepID=UPI00023865A3|nr:Sec-independent protein translocase protein TatB [Azoarcus sp. KH32C]BAL23104.1 Sec-independent protein translocase subunit B [Azoarcus sp. KH32C]
MFDLGFSEIVVIAVVTLIVVGPERLPKVARTVGHLLGRFQRYVSDVKSDIQREMQLEELKKLQQQVEQQARELESSFREGVDKVETDLGKVAAAATAPVAAALDEAAAPNPQTSSTPLPGEATATATADTPPEAPSAVPATPESAPAAEQPEVDSRQMDFGFESDAAPAPTQPKEKA